VPPNATSSKVWNIVDESNCTFVYYKEFPQEVCPAGSECTPLWPSYGAFTVSVRALTRTGRAPNPPPLCPAPLTGTAVPECSNSLCFLDCSSGETCPDEMFATTR
jgi:hypothetical protein